MAVNVLELSQQQLSDASKRLEQLKLDVKLGELRFDITAFHVVYPDSKWRVGRHMHSCFELHLIPAGSGTVIIEDQSYKLKPGTLYLTGPGIHHEQMTDPTNPMMEFCIRFNVRLEASSTSCSDESILLQKVLDHPVLFPVLDRFGAIDAFARAIDEIRSQSLGYYQSICSLLQLILIASLRVLSSVGEKIQYAAPKRGLQTTEERLMEFLQENYANPCSLNDMEGIFFLSMRQLNRRFQARYNSTIHRHLVQLRVQAAQQMLADSSKSITEISTACGFVSESYFSQTFRRVVGASPSEYRKKLMLKTDCPFF